jgi:hypothetical protein
MEKHAFRRFVTAVWAVCLGVGAMHAQTGSVDGTEFSLERLPSLDRGRIVRQFVRHEGNVSRISARLHPRPKGRRVRRTGLCDLGERGIRLSTSPAQVLAGRFEGQGEDHGRSEEL